MNTFSLQLIIFGSNFSPAVPYLSVRLFGKLDIISRRLFVKEMIHLADYDTVLEMPIIGKNHRRRRPKVWSALAVARCYLLMSGDYRKSLLNTKDQTVNGNQIAWYFKNVCKAQRKDKTETNVKKQHKTFFFLIMHKGGTARHIQRRFWLWKTYAFSLIPRGSATLSFISQLTGQVRSEHGSHSATAQLTAG